MRVSIVNLNWEGRDAIGQCILNQARVFQRRGDEVRVCLAHSPRNIPDTYRSLVDIVNLPDLIHSRNMHFASSDLYIFHYPTRYSLLESIKALERGVVIFHYHGVTPPDLWQSSFLRNTLRDSVASVGLFASHADLIVADSAFGADQLVQEYSIDRDRIRVLPLAVALDRFSPGPKDSALLGRYELYGKRVILFVGRMAGNKRIDLLVETLPQVLNTVPNAVLMLVGDDRGNPAIQESVARARRRAADLGVDDAVMFMGQVDELPRYYRLADVYATASLHEGFGVPLIEAMASGVPIVASRATAHPWVVGEAGLLTEPEDVTDLAEKVVQVLTDDALCGQLVQRGLARAREFSLERYKAGWTRIVAEAAAWLPSQPYPCRRSVQAWPEASQEAGAVTVSADVKSLNQLEASADVILRDYEVRSGLPLVGPLVAWIRRNLTSHLREPYVDPTLEQQVAFNQRVARALRMLTRRVAECETRRSELEARIAEIEVGHVDSAEP